MSKFEVSILFKMVWVRASVISDKSSMRFLMTTIAMKCPNMKSQSDLKWFELELLLYVINLQWDDCYSNICDEMSKIEVRILFKMVWIRASVISYKSSMRWLLLRQLRWNVQIWSILSNVDWIYVIYFIE